MELNPEAKSILVSYLYWGDEWNEWVSDISGGIAPLKTHTFRLGGPFLRGQRVEVRHTITGRWTEGFISDVDGMMVSWCIGVCVYGRLLWVGERMVSMPIYCVVWDLFDYRHHHNCPQFYAIAFTICVNGAGTSMV